jgi:hypothetical protein
MRRNYIRCWFADQNWPVDFPVENRDYSTINLPETCYAFQYYSRTEVSLEDEILVGKEREFSERHVIGKLSSVDVYLQHLESNGIPRNAIGPLTGIQGVVEVRPGKYSVVNKKDKFIQKPA